MTRTDSGSEQPVNSPYPPQQPPPPTFPPASNVPLAGAYQPAPTPVAPPTAPAAAERSSGAIVAITFGAIVGIMLIALVALVMIGALADGDDDGTAVDFGGESSVPDAQIVEMLETQAGRTTWFVVVRPDADLSQVATDLVSLREAADVDSLDMLFFDEGGSDLQRVIDASVELDDLANEDEPDLDRILTLSAVFGDDWITDHSIGTLSPTATSDFELCVGPLGEFCTPDERETISPE